VRPKLTIVVVDKACPAELCDDLGGLRGGTTQLESHIFDRRQHAIVLAGNAPQPQQRRDQIVGEFPHLWVVDEGIIDPEPGVHDIHSCKVFVILERLQPKHAVVRLPISFDPPRDSGWT
jgi:hypothetical protein